MSEETFLIIDAGSGGVKSLIVSPKGLIFDRSERSWDRKGWNSDGAWMKITSSLSEIIRRKEFEILAICCTGMREEFVLLDDEGEEIKVTLTDESKKYGYQILEEFGEEMYKKSGHWPVPNWMAGAILPWLRKHRPESYNQISAILMISDWVNFKLTGIKATEGTCACETSLFNMADGGWDQALMESLGLDVSIFPDVKENGRILGFVQGTIPDGIRVLTGVPVVTGGADTQCGLMGMGTKRNEVGAVGGTTTPIQAIVESPVLDPMKRTWTNNHLIAGNWVVESNVGYTGRGVRWARDEFGCGRGYDELNKLAENSPPGSQGLQSFLGPHLFNSGPPFWDVDKTGDLPVKPTITDLCDFSLSSLVRSIYEANSYGVRMNLEQLERVTEKEFDYLKFCGGNSNSNLWMQIQADVLGKEILVPQVNDATAIGAAVLAAKGVGYYKDLGESVDNMVGSGKSFKPRVETSKTYSKLYEKWVETRWKISRL